MLRTAKNNVWRNTGGKIPCLSTLDVGNQSHFMGSFLGSFEV